jgi:hypothetical protein
MEFAKQSRRRFFGTAAAVGSALWTACSDNSTPPADLTTPDDLSATPPDLTTPPPDLKTMPPDLAEPYNMYGNPHVVPCGPYDAYQPSGVPLYREFTYPYGYKAGPYGPFYCYYPYYATLLRRRRGGPMSRRDLLAVFERLTNRPRLS